MHLIILFILFMIDMYTTVQKTGVSKLIKNDREEFLSTFLFLIIAVLLDIKYITVYTKIIKSTLLIVRNVSL